MSMARSQLDFVTELSRRSLFKALGGGIVLAAFDVDALAGALYQRGGQQLPQQISAWLHIGPDGVITVFSGKAEVGQNVRTSLTQAAAEELRVPPSSVQVVLGDTDLVPWDMGTFGSRSTPTMVPQIRRAAASARETLVSLAAKKWNVPREQISAADGLVVGPAGQSATYGTLAKDQPIDGPIAPDTPLTNPTEWKVLGSAVAKVAAEEVVNGHHKYTADMRRPGMLFAKVLRPPSFGAVLKACDVSAAEAIPGVHVVRDDQFVAVAAPRTRDATRALAAIKANWDETKQPSWNELPALLRPKPELVSSGADARSLAATYTCAYIAHVPLEPRGALAEWDGKKLTVFTGTQRPFGVRSELAQALSLPESQVRVVVPDTGSGYGGKHTGEAAVEAARIAKSLKKPIMVLWTRREEMTFAYFRPAGVVDVSASVDSNGQLQQWVFDNYNSGGAALITPYNVDGKCDFHEVKAPLRQGSYRSLAACFNNFARETAMDELAHATGLDPLAFRLKNIKDARLAAVLSAVADEFAWGKEKPAEHRGFGIACGTDKGSYVACAIEVSVERDSRAVKLERIVSAYDCGAILNPAMLKLQVEGAMIMGIGGALFEQIEFDNGKILTDSLARYRVPRHADIPPMTTLLLDHRDIPSAGAGETPIIGIAPAIGNAIFSATGVRLRSMPLRLPGQ